MSQKIALVCDWLTNVGGAEKVLLQIHQLFPDAPIYTSQYDPKGITWFNKATIKTGWLQLFPASWRRFLGPLRQYYFSHLDLSDYDVIISVTGAEAKSIKKGNATHFCYCHVPTQYYWGKYDEYVKNPGFGILSPIVKFFFKLFVHPLKKADYQAAQNPDYFITISKYAQREIKKYYHREAVVIHPPVDVDYFAAHEPAILADAPYVIAARQVTWKRFDLAIKACIQTNLPLTVIGDGPEHQSLQKLAAGHPNIKFLPFMPQAKLKHYLQSSKAFIFPSLEPFGIAPVEALAAGCPVIAFAEGGSLDFISEQNGILFSRQTAKSLATALQQFESMPPLDRATIASSVQNFSGARFDQELTEYIHAKTH